MSSALPVARTPAHSVFEQHLKATHLRWFEWRHFGREFRTADVADGSLVAVQLRELEACQLSPNLMVPTR